MDTAAIGAASSFIHHPAGSVSETGQAALSLEFAQGEAYDDGCGIQNWRRRIALRGHNVYRDSKSSSAENLSASCQGVLKQGLHLPEMKHTERWRLTIAQDAIDACPASSRNLKNIKAALRNVIKTINEEYVDTRPGAEKDISRFDLLIAIFLASDHKTYLFTTNGPAPVPVTEYACLGSGAYIGEYFLRKVYTPGMSTRAVAPLAIQALAAAKEYVVLSNAR